MNRLVPSARAVLSALTVVITAAYILWTLQRVYLGTNPAYKDYKDITVRGAVTRPRSGTTPSG